MERGVADKQVCGLDLLLSRFELFRECHAASGRKSASAGKNEAFLVRRSPDDGSGQTVCRAHVASGAPDSPAC